MLDGAVVGAGARAERSDVDLAALVARKREAAAVVEQRAKVQHITGLGLGVEVSGGMGDPHAFVEPPCGDPHLGAAVSWSFAPGWITRAQAGTALGGPILVRMHLAYEF